jgi:carboxymethylenebutenolidase
VLEQQLAYGEAQRSNLVGYLAMPQDAAEPLPGIIVIHEWWGLNDNIKAMTRRLAGEGYVALAVDLYGGATAETPEAAQALMTALLAEPDAARSNLGQAYDYLEKYAFAPRIASIGWCLGGAWSLQTALLYPDALDAMVMYYGQVVTERDRLAPLNVPILGFFGAADESIPVREVQQFRAQLMELGKNVEVRIVPRADHAFANPSGGNYNEQAANEAWDSTLAFLERHLKVGTPTQAQ